MQPSQLLKCMADELRLRILALTQSEQELCVCELTEALQQSQPKISRHLAQLRSCGMLQDRRQGQWVFYSLSQTLPDWVGTTLQQIKSAHPETFQADTDALKSMGDRPERSARCC